MYVGERGRTDREGERVREPEGPTNFGGGGGTRLVTSFLVYIRGRSILARSGA